MTDVIGDDIRTVNASGRPAGTFPRRWQHILCAVRGHFVSPAYGYTQHVGEHRDWLVRGASAHCQCGRRWKMIAGTPG